MTRSGLLVALAAMAACKGKKEEAGPPPASVSGSAGPVATDSGSAGSAAAMTDEAGPAPHSGSDNGSAAGSSPFVTLGSAAHHGCLGRSLLNLDAVACITGHTMSNEPSVYVLTFVGSQDPPLPLATSPTDFGDAWSPQTMNAANEALAKQGVGPFTMPVKHIDKPGTTDLGKSAFLEKANSLVWTSKQTVKGGPNQPPTNKHSVKLKCDKTVVDVLDSESEGVNPTFDVWNIGDHLVVETTLHTGREGEQGKAVSAMVVDLAKCKVTRSDPPKGG